MLPVPEAHPFAVGKATAAALGDTPPAAAEKTLTRLLLLGGWSDETSVSIHEKDKAQIADVKGSGLAPTIGGEACGSRSITATTFETQFESMTVMGNSQIGRATSTPARLSASPRISPSSMPRWTKAKTAMTNVSTARRYNGSPWPVDPDLQSRLRGMLQGWTAPRSSTPMLA